MGGAGVEEPDTEGERETQRKGPPQVGPVCRRAGGPQQSTGL